MITPSTGPCLSKKLPSLPPQVCLVRHPTNPHPCQADDKGEAFHKNNFRNRFSNGSCVNFFAGFVLFEKRIISFSVVNTVPRIVKSF